MTVTKDYRPNLNDLTPEEATVFTNRHAYKPHAVWSQAALVKTYRSGQWGKKEGAARCWAECSHYDRITHRYQCDKPGKVELQDGSTWCGIHSPEAVAKREQRTLARRHQDLLARQAETERWRKESLQKQVFPILLEALQQIADGHNEPRALAAATLGKWPYTDSKSALEHVRVERVTEEYNSNYTVSLGD